MTTPFSQQNTTRYLTDKDIDDMFSFHPADTDAKRSAHEMVRQDCRTLAHHLNALLPDSPQKTVVIRQKLVEVMMYSNQAIAVYGAKP